MPGKGRPNLTDDQATPVDWVKDLLYGPTGELKILCNLKPGVFVCLDVGELAILPARERSGRKVAAEREPKSNQEF